MLTEENKERCGKESTRLRLFLAFLFHSRPSRSQSAPFVCRIVKAPAVWGESHCKKYLRLMPTYRDKTSITLTKGDAAVLLYNVIYIFHIFRLFYFFSWTFVSRECYVTRVPGAEILFCSAIRVLYNIILLHATLQPEATRVNSIAALQNLFTEFLNKQNARLLFTNASGLEVVKTQSRRPSNEIGAPAALISDTQAIY